MLGVDESGYAPPPAADIITVGADRLGVGRGLLLRFPQIYAAGELALVDRPRVAIVGARRATPAGRRRAAQLARDCARAGVVVISGLAEGVDHAAHTAAIEHGGKTIAVIGTSLGEVYPPRHAALQRQIYREHLLVSPFAPGERAASSNFPERNRLMAHLAMATVVIEASDQSGALHQVAESLQIGRPVFVTASAAGDRRLAWPARLLADRLRLGRVLRTSADLIDLIRRWEPGRGPVWGLHPPWEAAP